MRHVQVQARMWNTVLLFSMCFLEFVACWCVICACVDVSMFMQHMVYELARDINKIKIYKLKTY